MKFVIDKITEPFGSYPGAVEISFHWEKDGERDGFETRRVFLNDEVIQEDGSYNADIVRYQAVNSLRNTVWNICFAELSESDQQSVLAAPDGSTSANLAMAVAELLGQN